METPDFNNTINHLFRNESGKMVSVLIKIFGSEHLQMAEDVVQDALVTALEKWKYKGLPDNPKAWLYTVAKNKAVDIIRRKKHTQPFDFSGPQHQLLNSGYTFKTTMESFWTEKHIHDDFLGMMFACCHPEISPENQVTFILKTLCGFSVKEIAKAFFSNEETIAKRLFRTKEFFRKNRLQPAIPPPAELAARTDVVLKTIYLMFNEGYNSTHSEYLIREDIIEQALFLCKSLTENKQTRRPEVFALMALICFHAARNSSRLSQQGELILLPQQDRNKWNRELINLGNHYLNQSAFGKEISIFHLEAAIAYEHCTASSYITTNWKSILKYYDMLIAISPDPVVLLNRCIAIMELFGPQKALKEINKIENTKALENYYLYYGLLGELNIRLNNKDEAISYLLKARELTQSPREINFLNEKIIGIQHCN